MKNNKGNIGKVIGIFDGHCNAKYHIEFQGNIKVKRQYLSIKTIEKHSKNIKDIIEDGDYLNGYLVRKINEELCNFDLNTMEWTPLKNIDIFESLVTKQQFESIEYKI